MYLIVFSSEFMFYLCHLYLTTHNGVQQDFHIKWCAFRLKVTRHVPHMEQDLHTNTEYLSSSPIILWSVAQSLVFCVVLCIFFTFVLFLLAIVLYVLLWCMQFKYHLLSLHFSPIFTNGNPCYITCTLKDKSSWFQWWTNGLLVNDR